ncbi:hypothetical protein DY000_02012693 [Brassica cretica]|uniref:Uncharacterized protein n=1 Tax=Brassica cretica TaxID=69181 RepID=A0ABQ7D6J8_BRACR|nr:hypothetical protein DY000_02012693 [Brassica cretica]
MFKLSIRFLYVHAVILCNPSILILNRRELELIGSRIELLSGRERGSVSSVANWLVAEIGNANELSIELSIGSRTGCDRVASWNKLRSG